MSSSGSKVPVNRLSRLGNLASLAGRVAGGMLAEGARQLARGDKPSKASMLLTADNLRRVADKLAHLRGAAMKIGQLLSMDAGDLLPGELAEILARLRASANPMPPKQLTQVLRDQLGENWLNNFSDFHFVPIAAASIGQVHLAYHDDGRKLAVKIQYPGVKASIDSDVDNVATLLRVSGLLPSSVDYQSLLQEAKLQLKQEADYEREAQFIARYNQLLAEDNRYVLPQALPELSSSTLLCMTYVQGDPIESLQQHEQQVRDTVVAQLFSLLFRELFEFKLVQTDPNFANYLYNHESKKLVLLDFGACREYSSTVSHAYRRLFAAAIHAQQDGIEHALTEIGFFSQTILPEQKRSVLRLVNLACEPLQHDRPFDFGSSDLASRLRDAGTALSMQQNYWHTPPADALFLHRKIAGLYLLAARLGSRVNVRALLEPYLAEHNTEVFVSL